MFIIYMANNQLAYIQTIKFGASQIRWLSNLSLFIFTIKYRTGISNKATDALSQHQVNLDSSSDSETDNNKVDVNSHSSDCEVGDLHLNGTKVSSDLKITIQNISCVVEPLVKE